LKGLAERVPAGREEEKRRLWLFKIRDTYLTCGLEIYREAGPKIVAVRLLTLEEGARLRKLIELMMTGQKEISSLTRNKREHRGRWESIDESRGGMGELLPRQLLQD
jgi:hypothetical protein